MVFALRKVVVIYVIIELNGNIREPEVYIQDWQTSGSGPFRIKAKPLDYRFDDYLNNRAYL
ncbi:MAG: hypothetical protein GY943_06210 [Chloroflexi bacterium]|nr:hypothetical protein [Chloroflexota bacterium]